MTCENDSNVVKHSKWTKGFNERINRLRNRYWEYAPSLDIERAISYTSTYKNTECEDMIIRRAKSFKNYFSERSCIIYPDELIVGTYGKASRSALLCPDITWTWIKDEIDTIDKRPQDPYQVTEEDRKILREEIIPYWEGKAMEDYFLANMSEETRTVAFNTGVVFGNNETASGAGETAAGFQNIILKKGFRKIKEEAEKNLAELDENDISIYDKKQFYKAAIICCEAMKVFGERYSEQALKLATDEKDEARRAELIEIAAICKKVPYEAPETFREALQTVWFTQIALYSEENSAAYCTGRIDQYLYPYYKRDIESGILTDDQAQELLECFWLKLAEMIYVISEGAAKFYAGYQPFHGVTIGGVNENGEDAVNELSFMSLQAAIDIQMHAPSMNVRINEKNTKEFMLKVCELIECGTGQPALILDDAAYEMLRKLGAEENDIWDYCIAGCVTPQIAGKTTQWNEGGRYSYATAVEWVLSNGYSKVWDRQMGLKTGDPREFITYEEFEEAAKKQLGYVIKVGCTSCQLAERAHQLYLAKPFRSICNEGPMESGLGMMKRGVKYNFGPGLLSTGVADLADSMAAVKKLVFEDKTITMDTLVKALENDFEGYEDVRQLLINEAPKYGNDDPYVDDIAKEFVGLSCDLVGQYTSSFGSKYINGIIPVMANVPHGEAVWALPSGRKATTPLADGMSPYPGYDKNGPTSIIKSVCRVDHTKNVVGTLLNLKLTPNLIGTDEGKEKLIALIRAQAKLGGYHVQFNVVNRETLLEAQENPEKHADLLVRVAGYSAFFVELRKEAQDLIIDRTQISAW